MPILCPPGPYKPRQQFSENLGTTVLPLATILQNLDVLLTETPPLWTEGASWAAMSINKPKYWLMAMKPRAIGRCNLALPVRCQAYPNVALSGFPHSMIARPIVDLFSLDFRRGKRLFPRRDCRRRKPALTYVVHLHTRNRVPPRPISSPRTFTAPVPRGTHVEALPSRPACC